MAERAVPSDRMDAPVVELLRPLFDRAQHEPRQPLPAHDDPTAWFRIVAGKVALLGPGERGRRLLMAVLGPGDQYIDFPSPVGGRDRGTVSLRSITSATVEELPASTLAQLAAARPDVAGYLLAVLAAQLRHTRAALDDALFTDVPGRVAKHVLRLAERFGTRSGNSGWVSHDLTQQDLADLIGCSREAVNKTLAQFCGRGWLLQSDRTIHVRDWNRLQQRASRSDAAVCSS